MRRRWKILVLSACGVVAFLIWFCLAHKPVSVTLRDGNTLTLISSSYGKSFVFAPEANPFKRLWQDVRLFPYRNKTNFHFLSLAGTNDALFWFKHTAPETELHWSPPWDVLTEDGRERVGEPPVTGMFFQGNIHGTAGVAWKDCPTNVPTLTFAFYKRNTNVIVWNEYTDATFLGRITLPNPAYHR